MIQFAPAPPMMGQNQVRTSDVTNPRLIAAMLDIPRERLSQRARPRSPISISTFPSPRQRLVARCAAYSRPMVLAKLIQAAEVGENDQVLRGRPRYRLFVRGPGPRPRARWLRSEEDARAGALRGREPAGLGRIQRAGGDRDLDAGWPAEAPYDVIFINGAIEVEPNKALARQLRGWRPPGRGQGPCSQR